MSSIHDLPPLEPGHHQHNGKIIERLNMGIKGFWLHISTKTNSLILLHILILSMLSSVGKIETW